MAHTTLMKLLQATIVLQAIISGVQVAVAVVYVVGGAVGWDFAPTASYYSDWASELIFMPGDKLSFRYDPTDHNVLRVNISDYATCNTLNPVQQYQSGNDLITLDKPGAYCFICGFAGHCEGGGMLIKLAVMGSVAAVPPPPEIPPPPPPVPLKSPPPPSPPPVPLKSSPPPPPVQSPPPPQLQSPPPPVAEVQPPPASPLTGHPPSPAYPPPPKLPLSSPPPAVVALPPPPSPPSHSSPKSSPWRPPSHENQTNVSPSTPAAPPPMLTVAPGAPSPAAFNETPAPSPDDFDPDSANLARHFRMGCLVSSLVIAGAVLFW